MAPVFKDLRTCFHFSLIRDFGSINIVGEVQQNCCASVSMMEPLGNGAFLSMPARRHISL